MHPTQSLRFLALALAGVGSSVGCAEPLSNDATALAATADSESGAGSITFAVPRRTRVQFATLPAGPINIELELRSSTDLDLQVFDGQTPVVQWPAGVLAGETGAAVEYDGALITYSGYGGDGSGTGNERLHIGGNLASPLTVHVFGYSAGVATVNYEFGQSGVGASCGSRGLPPCAPNLVCKNGDDGAIERDVPGTCQTETWCESEASAASDCEGLVHVAVPGRWGCESFECVWRTDEDAAPPQACSLYGDACAAGSVCDYECPTATNCGINPQGTCRLECTSAVDCDAGQYCTTTGVCRADSTCGTPADCTQPDNDWDSGACIATRRWVPTCEAQSCGFGCAPLEP